MKWAALAIVIAAVVPLVGWLRRNPGESPKVWMLIGFLPFGIGSFHLYMAAISWPLWPGYAKGVEISVLDLLAIALYFGRPRSRASLPFQLSISLYLFAVILSMIQSPVPMASFFYAWQIARMFLVYAVVAKACDDPRVPIAILGGMGLGLCMEAIDASYERFVLGILQAGGTLGHQNFLGLMSHFAVFPCFALLLAGERGWRPIIGPVSGLITTALTVSRGTIGLAALGYFLVFAISSLRQWTARKAVLLGLGFAVACLLVPVVLASFATRFSAEQTGDYDERAAFESAATMMISDHPMGVGANYYVVEANVAGYNDRAHVAYVIGSDSANVHNIYYLITAETGYLGLLTFVFMLIQPLIVAFRCGWRNKRDRRGDLLLGLGVALLIVYVHSFFEWIFISFQAQYMFALDAGLVAGLATQLGYWRNVRANVRANVEHPITTKGLANN